MMQAIAMITSDNVRDTLLRIGSWALGRPTWWVWVGGGPLSYRFEKKKKQLLQNYSVTTINPLYLEGNIFRHALKE